MESQQDVVEWAGGEGDVPQFTEYHPDLPYDNADLPLPESFPSPPPPLDDCSYQDNSSESSSMCFSLSEPPSEGLLHSSSSVGQWGYGRRSRPPCQERSKEGREGALHLQAKTAAADKTPH